ncbi:MAG: glutamine--fructose-6-phosphate transaminase (isomerizing) [Rickettsiales bacterium]|jgi:glucosamine--fructose-6-phosphate aminotransferase (isomerizing)|nr:glutamine--fructose-6-phosphate transaminase (isomerizing) [Rickettsiales bacterium]
MCGIFGIVSNKTNVIGSLVNALKALEYRGYDSAGITTLNNGKFNTIKKVGKVAELEKVAKGDGSIGIAHTRWATHGGVTEENAHPHNSNNDILSLVHNGIIENYKELKDKLTKNGLVFYSQTDTEVASNLIEYYYKKLNNSFPSNQNRIDAILSACNDIRGSYGFAIIFADNPNELFITRQGSPLLLGVGENENYVASGLSAFSGLTNKIISLQENDLAIVNKDSYIIYNNNKEVKRDVEIISIDSNNIDKGDFAHYMLKEIYEEPKVVRQTIKEYINNNKIVLPNFNFDLSKIEKLNIVSCGTSYYASFVVKYFIEQVAKVKVDIDIASEFRYKKPVLDKNDFAMFISQSGETADTIAALKLCKDAGQKIISVVNVLQSNIAYLSDIVLKTLAGTEIGVASTKAFMGQIATLYLFGVEIAKVKNLISEKEYQKYIDDLIELPSLLEDFLSDNIAIENIKNIAKECCNDRYYIFIGRDIYYPLALEGSLKISEIGYVPCIGYAGGELKHGPIAIIDKDTHVFAINPSGDLFEKSASNIEEIMARKGNVVLFTDKKGSEVFSKNKNNIVTPSSDNKLISALLNTIAIQLVSYYIALEKGNDIDKPRNLAKSVTVE